MAGAMAFIVSFGAIWLIRWLMDCGLSEWFNRWAGRFVYIHGEFACPRRLTDFNDRFYQ